MTKKLPLLLLALSLALTALPQSALAADPLSAHDRDYLIRAVAAQYPDVTYAARVAIVSVILCRVESPDYPSTAAGVIASMPENFPFPAPVDSASDDALRLTEDACRAVEAGARPVGELYNFTVAKTASPSRKITSRLPLDFRFDNRSESERLERILAELSFCPIVIDGIGFY